MRKADYLNNIDVSAFVDWLARELERPSLTHRYTQPNGITLTFSGLDSAFQQYDWAFRFVDPAERTHQGRTFTESAGALATLRSGLATHLSTKPINDRAVCDWACSVMAWGGVTNGNVAWLRANVTQLTEEIETVRAILSQNDDNLALLRPIRRFNAGMTKVYSLLVPDFIIYDSRVAAALAWLVVMWCQQNDRSLPDLLAFPCMPPKEGENPKIRKSRNPSTNGLQFPAMRGNVRRHAQWNLRASWILRECLDRSKETVFHAMAPDDLRALEAALFMWGYDLSQSPVSGSGSLTQNERSESACFTVESASASNANAPRCHEEWKHGETLGRPTPFRWLFDIDKDSIIIDRDLSRPDEFSTAEIFYLLHRLYDRFGHDWFPLANNVQRLPEGTEVDGLGSTLYRMSPDTTHAQAASQLGPILMQYGLFEWNQRSNGIRWRIVVTPPPTIDDLRMLLSA